VNLVDANVLLYAVNEDEPRHRAAQSWLDDALAGTEAVGFSWIALLAFVRLITREGLFPRPLEPPTALAIVAGWLEQPPAVVVEPTTRHLHVLTGLLDATAGGNLVNDAHLAALAIEHGATVVSYDSDFERFAGVRTHAPS
jgi:toxin-antitoxin system PIN domain toxin